MKKITIIATAFLFAVVSLAACDVSIEEDDKSGASGDVARRNTMNVEGEQEGAGVELVQPDIPPSEEDVASFTDEDASLALHSEVTLGQHPRHSGHKPFLAPYFLHYVFKVTVLQNDKVVKEYKERYMPHKPLQLRGLEPGKYVLKVEILRKEEVLWAGTGDVEIVKDQVVQAKITLKKVKPTGVDVIITPEAGEQKKCDFVPDVLKKDRKLGRFECSIEIKSAGLTKPMIAVDVWNEDYAKRRLLQNVCNKDLKPTKEELENVKCKRISLISHPRD